MGDSLSPVITGAAGFRSGGSVTLDAGGGYDSYGWNTGDTTETITVARQGLYLVEVRKGDCKGTSHGFAVAALIRTRTFPYLQWVTVVLHGRQRDLSADSGYATYLWSNGDTTRSITVKCPARIPSLSPTTRSHQLPLH